MEKELLPLKVYKFTLTAYTFKGDHCHKNFKGPTGRVKNGNKFSFF